MGQARGDRRFCPDTGPGSQRPSVGGWQRTLLNHVEDFQCIPSGNGFRAMQLSEAPFSSSLASYITNSVCGLSLHSSSKVLLSGTCSTDKLSFYLCLQDAPGSWCNYGNVGAGSVGIFQPGEAREFLLTPGSLFIVVSCSASMLASLGGNLDKTLDRLAMSSGIHQKRLSPALLSPLQQAVTDVHRRQRRADPHAEVLLDRIVRSVLEHYGHHPIIFEQGGPPSTQARVVTLARQFVETHLSERITVPDVTNAARTSERTLHRSFEQLLGESLQHYVRVRRLHQIRAALQAETPATVASIASQWGIHEFGRLSRWYRELFGELPSETVLRRRASSAAYKSVWNSGDAQPKTQDQGRRTADSGTLPR